jgi:hypothetical protein
MNLKNEHRLIIIQGGTQLITAMSVIDYLNNIKITHLKLISFFICRI